MSPTSNNALRFTKLPRAKRAHTHCTAFESPLPWVLHGTNERKVIRSVFLESNCDLFLRPHYCDPVFLPLGFVASTLQGVWERGRSKWWHCSPSPLLSIPSKQHTSTWPAALSTLVSFNLVHSWEQDLLSTFLSSRHGPTHRTTFAVSEGGRAEENH